MIRREQLASSWRLLPIRRVLARLDRQVRDDDEVVTAYRDGLVDLRSRRREEGYTVSDKEHGYQGVEPGDVVFHALDGFAGAVGVSRARGKCSPVYHVCSTIDEHDPRFIVYGLRTMSFLGYLESNAFSVRQRAVDYRNWDFFARLELPCPPPQVQRLIADYLDSEIGRIDRLISAKRHVLELERERVVAARRGVMDRLASTRGRISLRRCVSCLDARRVPLNQIERAERVGEFPYWGAGQVLDHIDSYLFDETIVLLGEDGAPFFDDRRDVAFVVSEKVWVNNHMHVLRPNSGWNAAFLCEALNATDYGEYITGSTRDKLTQEEMLAIRVPRAQLREQEEAAGTIGGLLNHEAQLRRLMDLQVETLQEHRQALITAAVTGELDVTRAA